MLHVVRKGALLTLALLLAMASGAPAASPTEEVKSVVDQVLRILQDPALKAPAQKKKRRQMLKQTIDRRFDYEEMARRCLGPSWRGLSPAQRTEFVRLFGQLLEASYADKLERYSDEQVVYSGETVDGDYAEVRTAIVRKNDRIPIVYRLLNKSPWMVYDIIIEGVSLVNNYRSQFGRIIQESSYQELMRRLRAKVDELQKLEKL
ncbi:MAG: ABC transporter substrate-binding protein [Deltaproteobacteria bacterium]|nr:ABC transporter substrate-binding protein [Deltaproteobacteria bacterium]